MSLIDAHSIPNKLQIMAYEVPNFLSGDIHDAGKPEGPKEE
jgi:hypothetical protein